MRAVIKGNPAAETPLFFYGGPTYGQTKRVAFNHFKKLFPKDVLAGEPTGDMVFKLKSGAELHLVGMDAPQRIEGNQWCGGVIDESADIRPGTFERSIRPALTHYSGWCWRIGVPKRFGVGAVDYKQFYQKGERGEGGIESFTWPSWDILPKEEIDSMRANLDPIDFEEQAGGAWQTVSGLCFYSFSREQNSDASISYDPTRPIIVGSDFNVSPMAWALCQLTDDGQGLNVFDELWLNNTNTERSLNALWERYGAQQQGGWEFYGDASGRARKTSATLTDYLIIKNDERFKGIVRYPKKNPAVRDRLAATNALLKNAGGQVRCKIHPRCSHLLTDLETRPSLPTGEPDDRDPNAGHITDGLGYVIAYRFPMRAPKREGLGTISIGAV